MKLSTFVFAALFCLLIAGVVHAQKDGLIVKSVLTLQNTLSDETLDDPKSFWGLQNYSDDSSLKYIPRIVSSLIDNMAVVTVEHQVNKKSFAVYAYLSPELAESYSDISKLFDSVRDGAIDSLNNNLPAGAKEVNLFKSLSGLSKGDKIPAKCFEGEFKVEECFPPVTDCTSDDQCPNFSKCVDACTKDGDCVDGICEGGYCVEPQCQGEDVEENCAVNQTCVEGRCTDKAEEPCQADIDCTDGICEEGECVAPQCQGDDAEEKCAVNQTCVDGRCTDKADEPCKADIDCTDGICEEGECVAPQCQGDDAEGKCGADAKCIDGRCVGPCKDDEACPDGFICEESSCVEQHCDDVNKCPDGQTCVNGRCIVENKCNEDVDCGANEICENAQCIEEECNVDDKKCDEGAECVNRRCVELTPQFVVQQTQRVCSPPKAANSVSMTSTVIAFAITMAMAAFIVA